jgi:transcription-repair coupling factor (superfamily II helicase)
MEIIFTVEPNLFHQDNSYKSWSNFFSYIGNSLNNLDILYILEYISLCLTFDIEIQFTFQLSRFKEQLLESIDLFNKRNSSEIDNETVLLRAGVNYFIRSPIIDFEKIERGYKVFEKTWGLGIYTDKEKLDINGVIKEFYVIVNHKGEKLYINRK